MSASYASISSDKMSRLIETANAPTLVDVRIDEDFSADPPIVPGAIRRSHRDIQRLTGQSVVVICNQGQKLAEGTAAWLRNSKIAAEVLDGAAHPASPIYPGSLLVILALWARAPVAADGLMVLVRRGLAGVVTLAALGLPVASDRDILSAATILLAGLFRLLRRLSLLDRGGLRLHRASTECEGQCESGQQCSRCRMTHDGLPSSLELFTNSPRRASFVKGARFAGACGALQPGSLVHDSLLCVRGMTVPWQ